LTALEPHVAESTDLVPVAQRQLEADWRQAQRLALTNLVPDELRGKPNDVMAVVLFGRQYGLVPAHAVAQLWIIKGRIVPSAQVLAGVAMRAGHRVRITESSSETCTVAIRRREDADDPEGWQRTTFTIADAERAGLTKKEIWKAWTADMLCHATMRRAVKRVCADALLGIDDAGDEGLALETVRATVASEALAHVSDDGVEARSSTPEPAPPSEPIDVAEGAEPNDGETQDPPTPAQMRAIHGQLRELGVIGPARHPFVAERVGKAVTTLNDLTRDEASVLIDRLGEEIAGDGKVPRHEHDPPPASPEGGQA